MTEVSGRYYTVAVRGASGVQEDTPQQISVSTQELVEKIIAINEISIEHVISIMFTVTNDLQSVNPATALRNSPGGTKYKHLPLVCAQEPLYAGSLPRMIRILLYARLTAARQLIPVYINGAEDLRPDL